MYNLGYFKGRHLIAATCIAILLGVAVAVLVLRSKEARRLPMPPPPNMIQELIQSTGIDDGQSHPEAAHWWARSCGPDCIEIDSAFIMCARPDGTGPGCDDLFDVERTALRDLAPSEVDIAGSCGANIVGWGAPGEYNPQTSSGSKRLRVAKDPKTMQYRFTRQEAGAEPGAPCEFNIVRARSGSPSADPTCDDAAGKSWCWDQSINSNLTGAGTHLGGPFLHGSPESGGVGRLQWGDGTLPTPLGDLPNGP